MRALVATALSVALLTGCFPESIASPTPTISSPGGVAAECAPAIPSGGRGTATLTLLPHVVGSHVLFRLDGSFVASAYGYPLGAKWQWWELADDGTRVREFEWRWQLGILQSPDGRKAVYGGVDPISGRTGLFVRDMNGPERFLAQSDRPASAWLDADRVRLDPVNDLGVVRAIDTRGGAEQIVFIAPPPPAIKAEGDIDSFELSGDLRWAIFQRWDAGGALLLQELFDVAQQRYVAVPTLGLDPWLSPAGDLAVWLDGTQLRAMHLCDRRVVTIGTISPSTAFPRGVAWSGDGRLLSFSFGMPDQETGPERVVVVDVQRGVIAEVERPWGFIQQWSPDASYVVLSRSTFHAPASKLAKFEFR